MLIYIFFMMYRLVVACNEAGCSFISPEKLALIAVGGGIEMIIEIKNVVAIFKRKG